MATATFDRLEPRHLDLRSRLEQQITRLRASEAVGNLALNGNTRPVASVPTESPREIPAVTPTYEIDYEMFEAMMETPAIPRPVKPSRQPSRGLVPNPTWDENTDTYTRGSQALYFAPPEMMAAWNSNQYKIDA